MQHSRLATVTFALFTATVGPAPLSSQARAQAALPDYAQLVDQVGGSVVHVFVESPRAPTSEGRSGTLADALSGSATAPALPSRSRGSAFVFSSDGYLVTAVSVVDRATKVVATLTDGREFPAKIVGMDKRTDIALLKIDATGLPPVKFGDTLKVRTGQRVLLVGSAVAGANTVAEGLITFRPRGPFPDDWSMSGVPHIATTIPVHVGNGGAPIFDSRGEVLGMVTMMYVRRDEPFAPLSFAPAADVISSVVESLRTKGYVSRGAIRITIQEVTKDLADTLGLRGPRGALVNATQRGGPADRAGIRKGDIILQFDKQPVNGTFDIPFLVGKARPGSRVPVQVWREGATLDLVVEVEELDGLHR